MNLAERIFQALTSGSDPLRAYQDKMPRERTLPAIVITAEIAGEDDYGLQGANGLRHRISQLDVYASTRKGADDYAELAREKMAAATTFAVARSYPSGAPDFEPDVDLFRNSIEFSLWYEA